MSVAHVGSGPPSLLENLIKVDRLAHVDVLAGLEPVDLGAVLLDVSRCDRRQLLALRDLRRDPTGESTKILDPGQRVVPAMPTLCATMPGSLGITIGTLACNSPRTLARVAESNRLSSRARRGCTRVQNSRRSAGVMSGGTEPRAATCSCRTLPWWFRPGLSAGGGVVAGPGRACVVRPSVFCSIQIHLAVRARETGSSPPGPVENLNFETFQAGVSLFKMSLRQNGFCA